MLTPRRLLGLSILIVLGFTLFLAQQIFNRPQTLLTTVGDTLPATVILALSHLPSDTLARPYLLFYGNADCVHCRAELSRWAKAGGEFAGLFGRVRVVLLARSRVATLADEAGRLAVDTLVDPTGALQDAMGVRAYPTMLFVGPGYEIRGRHVGEFSEAGMREALVSIVGAGG